MSAGRMFATLAVIAAGMLAAGLLISRAARTLHNDGLFNSTAPSLRRQLTRCAAARHRGAHRQRTRAGHLAAPARHAAPQRHP